GRVGQIERLTKAKIERVFLPKVAEIKEKILSKSMEKFNEQIAEFKDEEGMNFESFKEKFAELDKEDLIKGIYGFMFENTLKRYQKAQDIDVLPRDRAERPQGVRVQNGMQRFFINLGTMDGANPGELLKFVAGITGVSGRDIGRIETKEKFAFIEAPAHLTDAILNIKGEMFGTRRVSIELATAPAGGGGGRGFGGGGYGGGYRGGNRGGSGRSYGGRSRF